MTHSLTPLNRPRLLAAALAGSSLLLAADGHGAPLVASPPASAAQTAASARAPATAASAQPQRTAAHIAASKSTPAQRPHPWVALDVGHRPGEGTLSATGMPEHNYNLRFAAALEQALRAQGVAVKRLPTVLSNSDRARRAAGAALVVSVHHHGRGAKATPAHALAVGSRPSPADAPADFGGYVLAVGRADGLSLRCAQHIGHALQLQGRPFSDLSSGGKVDWADIHMGVRKVQGHAMLDGTARAVLVDVANITRPAEDRLARNAQWTAQQAGAVARGVAGCLGQKRAPRH
jgi:N-acetylmuramoyl-L-alanine amidase